MYVQTKDNHPELLPAVTKQLMFTKQPTAVTQSFKPFKACFSTAARETAHWQPTDLYITNPSHKEQHYSQLSKAHSTAHVYATYVTYVTRQPAHHSIIARSQGLDTQHTTHHSR
jgi:hypothetical protein